MFKGLTGGILSACHRTTPKTTSPVAATTAAKKEEPSLLEPVLVLSDKGRRLLRAPQGLFRVIDKQGETVSGDFVAVHPLGIDEILLSKRKKRVIGLDQTQLLHAINKAMNLGYGSNVVSTKPIEASEKIIPIKLGQTFKVLAVGADNIAKHKLVERGGRDILNVYKIIKKAMGEGS